MTANGDARLPPEAYGSALAGLPLMGPARLAALLRARTPADAWAAVVEGRALVDEAVACACRPAPAAVAAAWRVAAARTSVGAAWTAHRAAGVAVHVVGHPGYPPALAGDHEPPAVLFSRGSLDAIGRPRVTLVGTRRCTHAGRQTARAFGRALADEGVAVVSGLALGIDGAAHEGSLGAGGAPPVGVVGSGLDVVYPRRHAWLWRAVADAGLLLSEAPLGAPPEGWRFPARNRILAALADVLVVVESHAAGGSWHTVEAALERDVRVLAVPGSIHSPASAGTNRLLAEGCGPACDVDDILAALRLETAGRRTPVVDARPSPAPEDAAVLDAVDWAPTATDTVLARTGLPPPRAALALAHLERDGWVGRQEGWWERLGPPG